MKQILLFLILIFSFSTLSAQGILSQTGGKVYIGITAGPSFPVGDFGDNNPKSDKSGYATTGYKVEINGGIRLFNLLEFSVMGFRNTNGTDPENLKNYLSAQFPSANVKSDDWVIYGALGGLGISYPLPDKLITDIRVLGGYLNVTSPEISLTTARPDVFYKIESKTVSSLVYLTSFGIRYPVLPKLYALIAFEYIGAPVKFNDVKTIKSSESGQTEAITSFEQSLDTWTITAGVKLFIL